MAVKTETLKWIFVGSLTEHSRRWSLPGDKDWLRPMVELAKMGYFPLFQVTENGTNDSVEGRLINKASDIKLVVEHLIKETGNTAPRS